MKLYIDTNVIIDAIKNRENIYEENIGDSAAELFAEAIACKYQLIFSDWLLEELRKHVIPSDIIMLFKMTKKKIISISYDEEDKNKALERSSEHPDDALHIVLAEKANADIIITSNFDHFRTIKTTIPIKKPKWL